MKLLDKKLRATGFQEWESRKDANVKVMLRHRWTYLGGGRQSSVPTYFVSSPNFKETIDRYPTKVIEFLTTKGAL